MPTAPRSYVVNVEAAIYADGSYLLVRRAQAEDHAAGALALVGGKVEGVTDATDVLEATLAREVDEEVGVAVTDLRYVESVAFVTDAGDPVVDVVFLCRHEAGTPTVRDDEEVAAVTWMTPEAVLADDDVPPWTARSVEAAEERRQALGW